MKVILALGSLEVGGTERQVVRLAGELKRRGHEVTVLVLLSGGPLHKDLTASGVEVWSLGLEGLLARSRAGRLRPIGIMRLWTSWLGLVWELRRRQPDVVHAFLFWTYVPVLPAAWLARVPLRLSGRRNMGTEKLARAWYPFAERIADRCSHAAVANAEAIAIILRAEGLRADKVKVIPNGIDDLPGAEEVERRPARGAMVANLIGYKGHVDLIDALASLDDPPVIDCYGEGPDRGRINEAAARQLNPGIFNLCGKVQDVPARLRRAQFAVLASHEEGLPNAVLEAMASGLPVVATRVGGVPELIEDGVTGLLVNPHDPEDLAHALQRLSSDPELRKRLGTAARDSIRSRFSWERCVDAYEELYRGG